MSAFAAEHLLMSIARFNVKDRDVAKGRRARHSRPSEATKRSLIGCTAGRFCHLACNIDPLSRGIGIRTRSASGQQQTSHFFLGMVVGAGQGELKYGAARLVHLCPQPAPMVIDDR